MHPNTTWITKWLKTHGIRVFQLCTLTAASWSPIFFDLQVFLLMMPDTGIKSIILTQGCLYGYTTAFNITNGNASYSHGPVERTLLGAGVSVSSTFIGLIPHLFQMKYPPNNFWLKRTLPIVFLAWGSKKFEELADCCWSWASDVADFWSSIHVKQC